MRQQKKETIPVVLGFVFIAAGLTLAVVYLFFETRKEVPEPWIYGSIGLGLALIVARKQLIAFATAIGGKFINQNKQ